METINLIRKFSLFDDTKTTVNTGEVENARSVAPERI